MSLFSNLASLRRVYSRRSFTPRRIKRRAMLTANQKIPPFKKVQAECQKLRSFPSRVHEYAEDTHAKKITNTRSTTPTISSSHLFILIRKGFPLKRFLLWNACFVWDSFINVLFFCRAWTWIILLLRTWLFL